MHVNYRIAQKSSTGSEKMNKYILQNILESMMKTWKEEVPIIFRSG